MLVGPRRARRALLALALVALAIGLSISTSGPTAHAVFGYTTPKAYPVIGLPLADPTLIGSSPAEAPGETWGYSGSRIVHYTKTTGWQLQPSPVDAAGAPLTGFTPASGPLAGGTTPAGGVAILGEDEARIEQLLVRNPDGPFREAPTLTHRSATTGSTRKGTKTTQADPSDESEENSDALLEPGESLFPEKSEEILLATVDQSDGHTGVFVVPKDSESGTSSGVLFYDGSGWAREPICATTEAVGADAGSTEATGSEAEEEEACAKLPSGFKVLGIDASSPQNAWLLAQSGLSGEGVALYHREGEGTQARWTQHTLGGRLGALFAHSKQTFPEPSEPPSNVFVSVTALHNGQPLTVTSQGVWIDGQLSLSTQLTPSSFTLYYDIAEGAVTASWCNAPGVAGHEMCAYPLVSSLPSGPYRSFAWPEGGQYGERVITGLREGVTLSLRGSEFKRVLGNGGESGSYTGAAFSSPEEGWLAVRAGNQLTHLTTTEEPDLVQPWPVPFRRPLTAIAPQPGATPGELGAQAIAVGQEGQVAHYFPGQGWVPEALLNSFGQAQTPDLRGVAWPEPGRAYAVGTNGAMWLWQQATGLWEPDPARPPNLFLDNLTAIAFNPNEPSQGYVVGQQGALLSYGKTWEQMPPQEAARLEGELGVPEREMNFTSVAFAGNEALATYQVANLKEAGTYTGGAIVYGDDPLLCGPEAPSCWHADREAQATFSKAAVPVRVAGLPDGGAVLASAEGEVVERQGAGSPWQAAPAGPLDGFPVALAPVREGATLRAVVSVDASGEGGLGPDFNDDEALREPPPAGQAPVLTAPYPLPVSGYLLRETPMGDGASSWADEEHGDFPSPNHQESLAPGDTGVDWPILPDPVLALALPSDGGEGWAVGGQTGQVNYSGSNDEQTANAIQTAGIMRYPSGGGAPTGFSLSPERSGAGAAVFAIGGNAQCASACADLAEDQLGPDRWLANALLRAGEAEARAFLYTGPHLAAGLGSANAGGFEGEAFRREEERYAQILASPNGQMGVYPAPSESDLDREGNLNVFESIFKPSIEATYSSADIRTEPVSKPSESEAYSLRSSGPGGSVRLIVLDYSNPSLGFTQQCWLANQLALVGGDESAIVVGKRALSGEAAGAKGEGVAADANAVIPILVNDTPPSGCVIEHVAGGGLHGASAYFFNEREQNRVFPITAGGKTLMTYGSGTLGYIQPPAQNDVEFLGASGFLLVEAQIAKREEPIYHGVHVKLIPNISQLAVHATNGVLLRRSQASLFEALARRPPAGMQCARELGTCHFTPDPYVEIPTPCQGPNCATALFPEYTFTSSNPDVGQFVEADPASPGGATVLQGAGGKPIPDEPRDADGELTGGGHFELNGKGERLNELGQVVPAPESGLFCAYNAGSTTITVRAGGLSASIPVKILSGSVEQPCGTVRLRHPPAPTQQASLPVPLPAPAPTPATAPKATLPAPPPAPAPAAATIVPAPHPPRLHPVPPPVPPAAQLFPLVALVPPPAPSAARPTPPSGTAQVPAQSPVSQQVTVAERERETESAIQHVHHMAGYRSPEEAPLPAWTLGFVLIALAGGVGAHRRRTGTLAYAEQLPDARRP